MTVLMLAACSEPPASSAKAAGPERLICGLQAIREFMLRAVGKPGWTTDYGPGYLLSVAISYQFAPS